MAYPEIPAGVVVPEELKVGGKFEELLIKEWLGVLTNEDESRLREIKSMWIEAYGTEPWKGVEPYKKDGGAGAGGDSIGAVLENKSLMVAGGVVMLLLLLLRR